MKQKITVKILYMGLNVRENEIEGIIHCFFQGMTVVRMFLCMYVCAPAQRHHNNLGTLCTYIVYFNILGLVDNNVNQM